MVRLGTSRPTEYFRIASLETVWDHFSVEEICRLSKLGATPSQIAIMAHWADQFDRPGNWFIGQFEADPMGSLVAKSETLDMEHTEGRKED